MRLVVLCSEPEKILAQISQTIPEYRQWLLAFIVTKVIGRGDASIFLGNLLQGSGLRRLRVGADLVTL
jgi:hypothetical protein